MLKDSDIARINELAHKQKSVGLTDAEKEEQRKLRQLFLENFRAGFKQQLESIEIVDPDDPRLRKNKHNVN